MRQSNLHIDFLNFTFSVPGDISPFRVLRRAQATVATLSPYLTLGDIEDKGLHGYGWSFKVFDRAGQLAGFIAAGGSNNGSLFFSFSGKGCRCLNIREVHNLLVRNDGRITRVDLAYDDMEGKRSPHDVRDAYRRGLFKSRGQTPKHDLAGPWDNPEDWGDGLTFYVGKRETGKMLRAYHKGRQLGDRFSPWTRFEVELRRTKRDIPLSVLLEPLKAFVGAYRWLEWAAEEEGACITMVTREEANITCNHLIHHAKRSYGKLLDVLARIGMQRDHIFEALRKIGTPSRLDARYIDPAFITGSLSRLVTPPSYETVNLSSGDIQLAT